jgi:hypothetical protein
MQQETNRRDFLKAAAAFGIAAYTGCAAPQQTQASSLDALLGNAKSLATGKFTLNEVKQAAAYALQFEDYEKNRKSDIKGKEKDVYEARKQMEGIVKNCLENGEGKLYVCLNLIVDENNGKASKKREMMTQVDTKKVYWGNSCVNRAGKVPKKDEKGKEVKGADGKVVYVPGTVQQPYFSKRAVLELVANAAPAYERLPGRKVRDYQVTQSGFSILDSPAQIADLLQAGKFQDIDGGQPFTANTHNLYSGTDYAQGVYNKDMPAAVRLVITKVPGYEKAAAK